jgi:hypothetical protein
MMTHNTPWLRRAAGQGSPTGWCPSEDLPPLCGLPSPAAKGGLNGEQMLLLYYLVLWSTLIYK